MISIRIVSEHNEEWPGSVYCPVCGEEVSLGNFTFVEEATLTCGSCDYDMIICVHEVEDE